MPFSFVFLSVSSLIDRYYLIVDTSSPLVDTPCSCRRPPHRLLFYSCLWVRACPKVHRRRSVCLCSYLFILTTHDDLITTLLLGQGRKWFVSSSSWQGGHAQRPLLYHHVLLWFSMAAVFIAFFLCVVQRARALHYFYGRDRLHWIVAYRGRWR
jgi:hypothetical protein